MKLIMNLHLLVVFVFSCLFELSRARRLSGPNVVGTSVDIHLTSKSCLGITSEMQQVLENWRTPEKRTGKHEGVEMGVSPGKWYTYDVRATLGERRSQCPVYCRQKVAGGPQSCIWWHALSDEYKDENGQVLDLNLNMIHPSLFPECSLDNRMRIFMNKWYEFKSKGRNPPNNMRDPDSGLTLDFGYSTKARNFYITDIGGGVYCPLYQSTVGVPNDRPVSLDHMYNRRHQKDDPRLNLKNKKAAAPGKFTNCEFTTNFRNAWNSPMGVTTEQIWHEYQIGYHTLCPAIMAGTGAASTDHTAISRPWYNRNIGFTAVPDVYDHLYPGRYSHCGMSPAFNVLITAWSNPVSNSNRAPPRSGTIRVQRPTNGAFDVDLGTGQSVQYLDTPLGVCPVFCRNTGDAPNQKRSCLYWYQEDLSKNFPPAIFTETENCGGSPAFTGNCTEPVTCDYNHGICKEGSCWGEDDTGKSASGHCTECKDADANGVLYAGEDCNIRVNCDTVYGTCTEGKCSGINGNGECDEGSCKSPFIGPYCNQCDAKQCSATATDGACSAGSSCDCRDGFLSASCTKVELDGEEVNMLEPSLVAKCKSLNLKSHGCSTESANARNAALVATCGALVANSGDLDLGASLLVSALKCTATLHDQQSSDVNLIKSGLSLNTFIHKLFTDSMDNSAGERAKLGFRNSESEDTIGWKKHPGLSSVYTLTASLGTSGFIYSKAVEDVVYRAVPAELPVDYEGDHMDFHRLNTDLDTYCRLPCPCGQVYSKEVKECVDELDPVLLLEWYSLMARCAVLQSDDYISLRLATPDLIISRASTCVSIAALTSTTIRDSAGASISVTLRDTMDNIRKRVQQLQMLQTDAEKDQYASTHVMQAMSLLGQNEVNLGSAYSGIGGVLTVPYHVDLKTYSEYLKSFSSKLRSTATLMTSISGGSNGLQKALDDAKTMQSLTGAIKNERRALLVAAFQGSVNELSQEAEDAHAEAESELKVFVADLLDIIDRMSASSDLYEEAASRVKAEQQDLLADNIELVKELHEQENAELLSELDELLMERVVLILDFTAEMVGLAREAAEGIGLLDVITFGGATAAKAAAYAAEIALKAASFGVELTTLDGNIQSLKDRILAKSNSLSALVERITAASEKIQKTIRDISDQWVAIGHVMLTALPKEGEVIEAPKEIYDSLVKTPVYWENLNARIADVLQFEGLCSQEVLSASANTGARRLLQYQQENDMSTSTAMSLRSKPQGDHLRRRLCGSTGGKNSPPANCEPDAPEVPDGADPNSEAVQRSARIDRLQAQLGATCASFKSRVTAMTSYGQDVHESGLKAVSLARRIGHLRQVVALHKRRVEAAQQQSDDIQNAIADALNNEKIGDMNEDELAIVVDMLKDSYITENAVNLLTYGMGRVLDLCNSIMYVSPNRWNELSRSCGIFRSIPIDPIGIEAFANEIDEIYDNLNVEDYSEFVYNSIGQVTTGKLMNITHMLEPSLEEWVDGGFEGSLQFRLRGPYSSQEDENVEYQLANNMESQSGPYFCNDHNIQATSLGIVFTDENDVPLGPTAALVDNDVEVSIDLSGNAVKTFGEERYHYQVAPYENIRFGYHLPDEVNGCRNNDKVFGFCRGVTQINFGSTLPLPSPYMHWNFTVTKGTEFLKSAKKVYIVADYRSVSLADTTMTCYQYPILRDISATGGLGAAGIAGIAGGILAAGLVPAAVWFVKKNQQGTGKGKGVPTAMDLSFTNDFEKATVTEDYNQRNRSGSPNYQQPSSFGGPSYQGSRYGDGRLPSF